MPKRGREEEEVTASDENGVDKKRGADEEDDDEEEDTGSDECDDDEESTDGGSSTAQNFVAWLEEGATSLSVGEVHFSNVEHTGSLVEPNTYCVVHELKLQPPPDAELETEEDEEPPLIFSFACGCPFRVLPAADCAGIPLDPVATDADANTDADSDFGSIEYSLEANVHQQFLEDILGSISDNKAAKVPLGWKLPKPATDKAVVAGLNAWWNAGEAKTGWDLSKIPRGDSTTETTLLSTHKSNNKSQKSNILMDLYRDLCAFRPLTSEHDRDAIEERFEWRTCLCTYFAWAVPNEEALEVLRNLDQPILEIGAGTGYWAWLLSSYDGDGNGDEGGVDIVAYDAIDSHGGHKHRFRHELVRDGGVEQASSKEHAGRALMLCWPDIVGDSASDDADRGTFGYDTLKAYSQNQGDTVIYIGELGPSVVRAAKGWGDPFPPGGSSASAAFQDELRANFELTQRVELPNWPPYNSHLTVWKRK